ncbi:MAG: surface carbohydrate biosynthesis protein [Balneolaceae bacterium]
MNIYIPIEVKVRELEGKTLLAMAAAERGHTVILGSKGDTRGLAKDGTLPPGIIHNKSLSPGEATLQMLDEFRQHGHIVTSQDEESGLLDETYDTFARIRYSEESVSKASRLFAWGDFDSRSLKKIFTGYSDRITPTGSPRVDFWRKEFAAYYQTKEQPDTDQTRPYILIASNFSSLLDENRIWNRIARGREAGYFDRHPEWEEHIYENSAYQLRLVYKFIRMIRSLSASHPDVDILLRPHPVESIEAWKKIIGEYPNVIVHRKGGISQWIRGASMLIHNGCTSALEAAASGLPRIAYRPYPSELEREIPNRISSNAYTLDDVMDRVSGLLNGRDLADKKEVEAITREILNDRLSNLEGKLAADRIVDVWEAIGGSLAGTQASPSELIQLQNSPNKDIRSRLKQKLVSIRNSVTGTNRGNEDKEQLLTSSHKFPSFTEEEMNHIHKNLQHTLGRFQNIEARRFGERSFVLSKE